MGDWNRRVSLATHHVVATSLLLIQSHCVSSFVSYHPNPTAPARPYSRPLLRPSWTRCRFDPASVGDESTRPPAICSPGGLERERLFDPALHRSPTSDPRPLTRPFTIFAPNPWSLYQQHRVQAHQSRPFATGRLHQRDRTQSWACPSRGSMGPCRPSPSGGRTRKSGY